MDNNHNSSRMMWMMALGCLVPIALILILGRTGIGKNWIWLGAIALMFGMHAIMMSGHKHSDDDGKKEEGAQPQSAATSVAQPQIKTAEPTDSHQHH